MSLKYMTGFGNGFETEALPGALPVGMNSPQRCAYGLYAEQLSGSPFTAPRASNERSWLYRIRPSVKHSGRFEKADIGLWRTAPSDGAELPPLQLRWSPEPLPKEKTTLLQGMRTITTAGDAGAQAGMSAGIYVVTASMTDQAFYNADGELLFVLEMGGLRFFTEFGIIEAGPGEIVVIPRGVKFRAELAGGPARPARKLGEEAVEAVIAAIEGDRKALTAEAADVLYHLLVVLHGAGVPLRDVMAELERRTAQSGLAEKASRGGAKP